MYIPWSWLKTYLIFPSQPAQEIAQKLSELGLETQVSEQTWHFIPLANRPDLFSWWGIAQEISILLNCPCYLPLKKLRKFKSVTWGKIQVNTPNCSEIQLALVDQVKVKDSPNWVKEYLASNNLPSVNNLVDIINLVRLETGQALNIYDYEQLASQKITVRSAQEKEQFVARNKIFSLTKEDLVVSSGNEIISLAGVIASQKTAISQQTTQILLEKASWEPASLTKTSQRLGLSTFPNQFFARGANLPFIDYALARAIWLIRENKETQVISWNKEEPAAKKQILISERFLSQKLGQKLTADKIQEIIQRLKFSLQKKTRTKDYSVSIPAYRQDLEKPEDLVEEIARLYDYNLLPSSEPALGLDYGLEEKNSTYRELIAQKLVNLGMQEIITYSLVAPATKSDFLPEEKSFHRLLAPKSQNQVYYRQSLIPSHLKVLAYNLARQNSNLSFFEISRVYFLQHGQSQSEEILALSVSGKRISSPVHQLEENWDFFWLKGMLENILGSFCLSQEISFTQGKTKELDPSQNLDLFRKKEKIGWIGKVNQPTQKKYQLSQESLVAQISLTKLFKEEFPTLNYQIISPFPQMEQDLSLVVPAWISASQIKQVIQEEAGPWLREVRIFDYYQSSQDKLKQEKSLAFRLTFQRSVRTLRQEEVETVQKKIFFQLKKIFDAKPKK